MTDVEKNPPVFQGIDLTPREIDIVSCILSGRTAQKAIARFLETAGKPLSPRTVETHVRNILRKVGVSSLVDLVNLAERSGKGEAFRRHYASLAGQNKSQRLPNHRASLSWTRPRKSIAFLREGHRWMLTAVTVTASALYLLDWIAAGPKQHSLKSPPRADLFVPCARVLLPRTDLLNKIGLALEGGGIRSVALIGLGGAGKTILARCYAHQQEADFVYELNAQTPLTLSESLERMAFSLCRTEEELQALKNLKAIQGPVRQREHLLVFARERLKGLKKWILIYDNVEKMPDVQAYLPVDSRFWGRGSVILTTRDSHIAQNPYVQKSLTVPELSWDEKTDLFTRILDRNHNAAHKRATLPAQAASILKRIESFPLDVSTAALYIRATGITYAQYVQRLQRYSADFAAFQARVVEDSTRYQYTRYDIVSLFLETLIEEHPDFPELMLLPPS